MQKTIYKYRLPAVLPIFICPLMLVLLIYAILSGNITVPRAAHETAVIQKAGLATTQKSESNIAPFVLVSRNSKKPLPTELCANAAAMAFCKAKKIDLSGETISMLYTMPRAKESAGKWEGYWHAEDNSRQITFKIDAKSGKLLSYKSVSAIKTQLSDTDAFH
ncbi:MAG: hypothetical protein RSF00_03290 [Oscillospiraceae bacterium]